MTEALEPRANLAPAEGFRELLEARLGGAYRLATAILLDATDAEDATHDAIVKAWSRRRGIRDVTRFDAWFDRIVVNTCRDRLRHRRRHPATSELPPLFDLPALDDPFSHAEDRDLVAEALASLSPDHRLVIALRFYRDLTADEIAVRIGAPVGTVNSRLHHALRRLRAFMDRDDERAQQMEAIR